MRPEFREALDKLYARYSDVPLETRLRDILESIVPLCMDLEQQRQDKQAQDYGKQLLKGTKP